MGRNGKRRVIIIAATLVALATLAFISKCAVQHHYNRARAHWKDIALANLSEMSTTNAEIVSELDQLKHPTPSLDFGFAHDHVILMTNGEYLVYFWRHGFNSGFVDHLFLARGTDGRWYYSTYHFCNSMVAISPDGPPASIAEFVKRYSVCEFDGKSDECLKHTWPP
jgi:hypothetical protein